METEIYKKKNQKLQNNDNKKKDKDKDKEEEKKSDSLFEQFIKFRRSYHMKYIKETYHNDEC